MQPSDDSLPPKGPTLQQAFEALGSTLEEQGARYAIIGGMALIHHTRLRATNDVDALVAVPAVALPRLFEALARRGFQVEPARNIREFMDDGITSIHFGTVLVDLMRPVIPACARVLDRTITAEVFGQSVQICSAEGLAVLKLMAMRPQDEADLRDLLLAYGESLDVDYIRRELVSFTANDDPRRVGFEALVTEAKAAK